MTKYVYPARPGLKIISLISLSLLLAFFVFTACGDTATPKPATTPASPPVSTTAASPGSPAASVSAASTSPASSPPASSPPNKDEIPVIGVGQEASKPFSQVWKVELDEGNLPQVVGEAEGLIYVKTRQGGLYALDAKTGVVIWKQSPTSSTGPAALLAPIAVVGSGMVAIGDVAAEKVTAYDAKSGQKKWDYNLKFDAPNRDKGTRFLGGKFYENTLVVAVSSKQDPFNTQTQTKNPEYLLVVGIQVATGKEAWSAATDPYDPQNGGRVGNVIFGSKLVIIESPDLTVGALDGKDGTRRWRVVTLFLLRTDNLDLLYSVVPEAGAIHSPRLRSTDPETGKLMWEKVLPVRVINDPPIVISPDEKSAYVTVLVKAGESYLFAVDLESNQVLWRYTTNTYGAYSLTALNNGVRLRNYGKVAGLVTFDRENPSPVRWAAGGLELLTDTEQPEGIYLTARNDKGGGLFYMLGSAKGEVRFASKTELAVNDPFFGTTQIYLTALDPAGKPLVYAFSRPG